MTRIAPMISPLWQSQPFCQRQRFAAVADPAIHIQTRAERGRPTNQWMTIDDNGRTRPKWTNEAIFRSNPALYQIEEAAHRSKNPGMSMAMNAPGQWAAYGTQVIKPTRDNPVSGYSSYAVSYVDQAERGKMPQKQRDALDAFLRQSPLGQAFPAMDSQLNGGALDALTPESLLADPFFGMPGLLPTMPLLPPPIEEPKKKSLWDRFRSLFK